MISKLQKLGTTTQVSDNDTIVGLQEEATIITKSILRGENKLDVISIVGMAGVGKTTLALSLYKTPSIGDHFDILAWCKISQTYQNRALLLSILDQLKASDTSHRSIEDDEDLADHFCRSFKKRRYLLVLDDVWDTALWHYLKRYLPDDGNGSRILITTRYRDVAGQIASKVNELHELSEENSWELFHKRMVEKEMLSDDLENISKGIVKKCKGLPLSIVIIAGVLSATERTEKKWNQIAKSVSSLVLSDPEGNCKAILELSYNHLPNDLRSCFLYVGSFPEGQEISVNHLIMRWIAEELILDTNSGSAEEVAKKYIKELIVKSLVIPVKKRSRGGVKTFRLHDLLRDFCLDKAKEKHFFTVLDKRNYTMPLQDPRRLIIIDRNSTKGLNFSCHSIRSMICYDALKNSEIENGIGSWDMMLLKVLKVDDLSHKYNGWTKFPEISSLVHLRFVEFGLKNQDTFRLSSSISKLQNLQIIILRCGGAVIEAPDSIWDMLKLRYVDISDVVSFEMDNNRLGNSLLENLRYLSKARVCCGDSKWLSKLSTLQRLKCVFVDDTVKGNRFDMLSFNAHLTSLKVENRAGRNQRFIITCQLPFHLQELTLSKFFIASKDISTIGRQLPHLEVLKINSCFLPSGYEWNVDKKDFLELKILKLRNMQFFIWNTSENSFPNLEKLWVEKCNCLRKIPLNFGYLPKLRLISVRECAPSVDVSARKIEELLHEEQNADMRVHVYPKKE